MQLRELRAYCERRNLQIVAIQRRWSLHLKPTFGDVAARAVGAALDAYVDKRRSEKAASATVNRELSLLKTALRLGATKHKYSVPMFPHLKENNVRTGFIEQSDFDLLSGLATELWLRLFLEMAFEFGWRKRELLDLRVRQANATTGTIRLDVGGTKDDEGREVAMTRSIRELVRLAAVGKNPDDYLLTREDGTHVRDFRKAWQSLCIRAGLGRMVCRACAKTVTGKTCECGSPKLKYAGSILHDFCRSAARELRRAGVAESTIMDIGGWKTRSMFKRYAINDTRDIKAAIEKREQARIAISHDSPSSAPVEAGSRVRIIN